MNVKSKIKKLCTLVIVGLLFLSGTQAFALENRVYLEGPKNLAPGSLFSVEVYVDAVDPINALEAEIKYSASELESVGFDNNGSIVSLWQKKPGATGGTITFSGGILSTFSGTKGKLIKLQFKALRAGSSVISFSKINFYAADGKGTVVIPKSGNFSLTVSGESKKIVEPEAVFEDTQADEEVARELEAYKVKILWKNSYAFVITGAILVFIGYLLYNKRKRKI